jgi:hypothetical protein
MARSSPALRVSIPEDIYFNCLGVESEFMIITEKTSQTIMVANLIAIVMITAIHYNTKSHSMTNGTVLGWNYLTQEFLIN